MNTVQTERKSQLSGAAMALLVSCCVFWGFQQTLIKSTLAEVPPLWQASLRFLGATLLLVLWCTWRGIRLWRAADARDGSLRGGLLVGSLFALEFCCIYLGLRDTTASRLTVFLYCSPFVVALLLPRVVPAVAAAERLRGVQWWGLGLAFVAVAFALSEGFSAQAQTRLGPNHLRGDALALCAGLLWGLTTLAIRATAVSKLNAETCLFYQLAVSALVMPLASAALGEPWALSFSAWAWTSLALQTGVGAFASYLAWMWLLTRYTATKVSSFVFITPVCALLFGTLWLKEPLSGPLVLAMLGVGLGIVLVHRKT